MNIVITGAESSGKTTLAKQLAAKLSTDYIPEYARSYLEQINRTYTPDDFAHIVTGQLELLHSKSESPYQIFDTGAMVLKVWAEVKYHKTIKEVERYLKNDLTDLYILCDPDITYEVDPLREHPHARRWLYDKYFKHLVSHSKPMVIVRGSQDQRVKISQEAIKQYRQGGK